MLKVGNEFLHKVSHLGIVHFQLSSIRVILSRVRHIVVTKVIYAGHVGVNDIPLSHVVRRSLEIRDGRRHHHMARAVV